MGFLSPVFLAAGALVAVPIILHLLYRQESKTFTFPAILYLLRTERDHARQIRTQQLLLLLLRVAIVALLVLLGARLHLPGAGGAHDPTALALVLDNSMSTTLVEDGRRRLDTLKAMARRSVLQAGHDDVIWVVNAGTPWEAAAPGGAAEALAAIAAARPGHGRGDVGRAVARARALVGQSPLPAREVHVFTDLQATALEDAGGPSAAYAAAHGAEPGETPVVVFSAPAGNTGNRGIAGVSFGGGLAPLAGRRTEAAVTVAGTGFGGSADTVGVRIYIGGQVRAAARAPVGSTVRLPAGPFPPGPVRGHVEIDPDPLTADDRRHFAFTVREPTAVAFVGDASFFLTEALAVLEESRRIVLTGSGAAETLVSIGGEGLERRVAAQSAFVAPHPDAARLPALNRRLAEAGVPWRYEDEAPGGARVAASVLPTDLTELEVRRYFRLAGAGPAPGSVGGPAGAAAEASLSSGDPWLVSGVAPTGPYVLIASPLDDASTSLPVSAAMIPLLEWGLDRWSAGADGSASVTAGDSFRPPPVATSVRTPDGEEHVVDGDQPFVETAVAGFYQPLAGDSVLASVPVNPPAAETDLTPASARAARERIPGRVVIVDDADDWSTSIFRSARGPEPWRVIAVLVLALLLFETVLAAAAGLRSRTGRAG